MGYNHADFIVYLNLNVSRHLLFYPTLQDVWETTKGVQQATQNPNTPRLCLQERTLVQSRVSLFWSSLGEEMVCLP